MVEVTEKVTLNCVGGEMYKGRNALSELTRSLHQTSYGTLLSLISHDVEIVIRTNRTQYKTNQ